MKTKIFSYLLISTLLVSSTPINVLAEITTETTAETQESVILEELKLDAVFNSQNKSVDLSWDAKIDHTYEIYKDGVLLEENIEAIDVEGQLKGSYSDLTVEEGKTYSYQVMEYVKLTDEKTVETQIIEVIIPQAEETSEAPVEETPTETVVEETITTEPTVKTTAAPMMMMAMAASTGPTATLRDYDYRKGILDYMSGYVKTSAMAITNPLYLFNNSTVTGGTVSNTGFIYDYQLPIEVNAFYFDAPLSTNGNFSMNFKDQAGIWYTYNLTGNGYYDLTTMTEKDGKIITGKKITSFYLKNTVDTNYVVNEVEFFGKYINVPDDNLKKALNGIIGRGDVTLNLTEEMMFSFANLPIYSKTISNITGLEYAVNVTNINLYNNNVQNFSALNGLTKLTTLNAGKNNITNISTLTNGNLTSLDVSVNSISDISPLQNLTKLQTLNIAVNNISNLSPLSSIATLTNLNASYNVIVDATQFTNLAVATKNSDNNYIEGFAKQYTATLPSETINVSQGSTYTIPVVWSFDNNVQSGASFAKQNVARSLNGLTTVNSVSGLEIQITANSIGSDVIEYEAVPGYKKQVQVNVIDPGMFNFSIVDSNPINFGEIVLNGRDQTLTSAFTDIELENTVMDSNEWKLSISAQPFTLVSNPTVKLPAGTLSVKNPNLIVREATDSNVNVTNQTNVIDNGSVIIANAEAGKGKGKFGLDFSDDALQLNIPAEHKIHDKVNGDVYTTAITVTYTAGP